MNGDLRLERADLDYSTRAGANNAHHLLPRSGIDLRQYLADVVRAGAEPNVIGLFVMFHSAALERAASAPPESASPAERAAEMRQILALECFALHFLEDAFAAGHVAGSWGPTAERKGTHDYYNEHGIEADTWDNEPVTLFGDAHMRPPDLERAGEAVRLPSTSCSRRSCPTPRSGVMPSRPSFPPDVASGAFDACKAAAMPGWTVPAAIVGTSSRSCCARPRFPSAGRATRRCPGSAPRSGRSSESRAASSRKGADGGFSAGREGGTVGSLDVGLRFGYGIDALLGDSGDGLVFVQGGILLQSRSTGGCGTDCPADPILSQFVPGLPARSALNFRLRMPFWLIPGDLLLAAPILAFANPKLLEKMAIVSSDGGLIPWQTKLSTPVGSLQFVAGRECRVNLFGYLGGEGRLPRGLGALAERSADLRARCLPVDRVELSDPGAAPVARVRDPLQLLHAGAVRRRVRHAVSTRIR